MSHDNDIDVLREMVRLAENRREEERNRMDKLNTYNLALIAFAGSFLSLLVTAQFPSLVIRIGGFLLIISIFCSLLAIRPRTIRGGTIVVDEDVRILRRSEKIDLKSFLLDTASFMSSAAESTAQIASNKTKFTIISAILLACALLSTYTQIAYATP